MRLISDVVDHVTRVRQLGCGPWPRSRCSKYAKQVYDSAEAGAELAEAHAGGGQLQPDYPCTEQAFYADAATRLSAAQHQATASREELVRLLGLDEAPGANASAAGAIAGAT